MLNTTNPKHFTYITKDLAVDILGGINLNNLDKLKVTLKVAKPNTTSAIRDSIDLYYHSQVEKLVVTIAERLQISATRIRKELLFLTDALEKYRLEFINTPEEVYELTTTDKKKAITFLKSKNLLEKTNTLIGQSGIVGEVNNRILMYLIFTSRKATNPLHCISLGKSGTGKSHLQNSIGSLIPREEVLEITSLSANALYYFGEKELNGKLLLIEDLDGAEQALYPIRELQSKRKLTKTVVHKDKQGERKTIHRTVEGKVTIAGCTTQENIYEDNANRSFLIYIDESSIQEERILKYQQSVSAGKIDEEQQNLAIELLRNVQRVLEPIEVRNPFAEHLKLPSTVLRRRRTNSHYLQFIEVVTFYHQYQRKQQKDKKTGILFIETTIEDIKLANEIILEVLVHKADILTNATRMYFEKLQQYLQQENKVLFTATEVRKVFKQTKTSQWRYQKQLIEYGYLSTLKENNQLYYRLETTEPLERLKASIKEQLEANLLQIKQG